MVHKMLYNVVLEKPRKISSILLSKKILTTDLIVVHFLFVYLLLVYLYFQVQQFNIINCACRNLLYNFLSNFVKVSSLSFSVVTVNGKHVSNNFWKNN